MKILKSLILAGLLAMSTVLYAGTDVKRVTSIQTGSLVQENQPFEHELAFTHTENIGMIGVSIPSNVANDSYLVFKSSGLSEEDLLKQRLYVLGVDSGFVEVGSLVDYNVDRLVYQVSYEGIVQDLYLSTNDGLDNVNIAGNPDKGQDITKTKMASGSIFEKNVQFYLMSLEMVTLSEDVLIGIEDIVLPQGGSVGVVYNEPSTVVDLKNTLTPSIENSRIRVSSDYDLSNFLQSQVDFSIKGIPQGFSLKIDDEICYSDCDVTVFMPLRSSREFTLNKPEHYLGYEISVVATVNEVSSEEVVVLKEGTNMNTYTVPYSYSLPSNPSYYSNINILSETDSLVYFDLVVTEVGLGINKPSQTISDVLLGSLGNGQVTSLSLTDLINIVGLEDANYHAIITFKSEGSLVVNVDNITPSGRTTVNVEVLEREDTQAN